MKSQISKIGLAAFLFLCGHSISASAAAVQVDPALASAITLQMNTLKNIYSKREKTQNKIIAAEAAVTVALDKMHKVEDKYLAICPTCRGRFRTSIKSSVQENLSSRKSHPT